MLQIEKKNDFEFLVYLENGKSCQFRTIEAAQRMSDIVEDILSEKETILKIVNIEDDKFDLAFTDEYFSNIITWTNNYSELNKHDVVYDLFYLEFKIKGNPVKLLPYAKSMHIRKKGAKEWTKESIDKILRAPETEEQFNKIVKELI